MLEPEALRRAITPRTRGIMLNSPSNPTGAVYGPEQLTAIARVLVDTDIWVMSDDVYEHIAYTGGSRRICSISSRGSSLTASCSIRCRKLTR